MTDAPSKPHCTSKRKSHERCEICWLTDSVEQASLLHQKRNLHTMNAPESGTLRVYYDGQCPLCLKEMRHLERLDQSRRLDLQDINAADFSERFPHIDPVQADRILHGELPDGTLIYGLDVTCLAWKLCGRGHWVGFLRWPLIRPVADRVYLYFARHRHRISQWFGGRQACADDRCAPR